MMFRAISVCVGCALGLIVGCGGPGLNFVPVQGTVTLDGKPLVRKGVMFMPESGTPGNGAAAITDQEGKYSLTAVVFGSTRDQPGIPPGHYRVIVYEPLSSVADESQGGGEKDQPAPAVGPAPSKSDIPAIYAAKETTPLAVEVPESGGAINLELVSKSG